MLLIWGKRSYGAVSKVGTISVKTVFGHFWYLPLFPMTSYYVDSSNDGAFELNSINWRSVLCGYVRVWAPVALVFSCFAFSGDDVETESKVISGLLMFAAVAAFIASYVLDRKLVNPQDVQVRKLMARHFGVAVDPYACATSLQMEIDERMRAGSAMQLDDAWYKRALDDAFSPAENVELALLRARCDQHDRPLQQTALQKLTAPAAPSFK
jgi:hypothetical protein